VIDGGYQSIAAMERRKGIAMVLHAPSLGDGG
jgi:hypothetical protein